MRGGKREECKRMDGPWVAAIGDHEIAILSNISEHILGSSVGREWLTCKETA